MNNKKKRVMGRLNDSKKMAIIRGYKKWKRTLPEKVTNIYKECSIDDDFPAGKQPENSASSDNPGKVNQIQKARKKSVFHRAMNEYQRKEEERKIKKEEREAAQKAREEAIKVYKKKKIEKLKKLSKRTKWGQPLMSVRMEMLLEKIQKTTTS